MKESKENKTIFFNEKNRIWTMKSFAIMCVVCAHCGEVLENSSKMSNYYSEVLRIFGTLGVPIFFFLLGYLFEYKEPKVFLINKFITLIIPWITIGTMVYFYTYLRKNKEAIGLLSWIKWIIGDGTYLWYMSVSIIILVVLEIIFFIKKNTDVNVKTSLFIITTICIVLYATELFGLVIFHPYLNPFHWGWLSILGLLSKTKFPIEKWYSNKYIFILLILIICMFPVLGLKINYWSTLFPIMSIFVVFASSSVLLLKNDKIVILGKYSYSLYLLHMPIAGIITKLMNYIKDPTGITVLVRPFLVLLITLVLIQIAIFLSNKINANKFVKIIMGVRNY